MAGLLYKAATEHGWVDADDVFDALDVTEDEVMHFTKDTPIGTEPVIDSTREMNSHSPSGPRNYNNLPPVTGWYLDHFMIIILYISFYK